MTRKKARKYAEDGVNVAVDDDLSGYAAGVCRGSYGNSEFIKVMDLSRGSFRGPRGFDWVKMPRGTLKTFGSDGTGTKVAISAARARFETLTCLEDSARDLLAMVAMDITCRGGKPLVITNVLDIRSGGDLETRDGRRTNAAVRILYDGLGKAAKAYGLVLLNGETASLGVCVSGEDPSAVVQYNWSAACFGAYHPRKMILGDTVEAGMVVIALREHGFRSNGISSVRKALAMKFGSEWYRGKAAAARAAITAAGKPSAIYDPLLTTLHNWPNLKPTIPMDLIVHLTGGALKSKFGNDILFPLGLSAHLDDLFEPPKIMRQCAEWRGMPEEECYEAWNGGQGAVVVVRPRDVERFIAAATTFGIEARRCGHILSETKPVLAIDSKYGSGDTITYHPEKKRRRS